MSNLPFYDSAAAAEGYLGHGIAAGELLLIEQLAAESGPLLDIGCGSGRLFERMASVRPELTGVDYAQEQLRLHAVQFPAATLVRAQALQLPFKDDTFSTAVMGYHLIESILPRDARQVAFVSAARVLLPGGSLFLTRHVMHNYHLADQVRQWFRRGTRELGDLVGPARIMNARQPPEPFRMHVLSRHEIRRLTRRVGFDFAGDWDFDTGGRTRPGSRALVEHYTLTSTR